MKKRLGQKIATQLIRMGFTVAVFVANLWELVTSRQLVVMASSVVAWECPQNQIYAQKIAQTNSGITHPYNLTEVHIMDVNFDSLRAHLIVSLNDLGSKIEDVADQLYRDDLLELLSLFDDVANMVNTFNCLSDPDQENFSDMSNSIGAKLIHEDYA